MKALYHQKIIYIGVFYLSNPLSVWMFYLSQTPMCFFFFFFITQRSVGVQRPWGSECSQGGGAGGAGGRQRGWVGAGGTSQQILSHSPGWLCPDSNHWYFWWSHKVQYFFLQVFDLLWLNLLKNVLNEQIVLRFRALNCMWKRSSKYLCFEYCLRIPILQLISHLMV